MQKYLFRKYDSDYLKYFVLEKNRLNKLLGNKAKIEHVGSTAIPNLGGKGILDILIGVSKTKIDSTKKLLENDSYEFRQDAGTPERLFFRRIYLNHGKQRRVHIHLTKLDSKDWQEMIAFRDYLLNNPKAVNDYILVKKEAVLKASGNREIYIKHKEKFIKDILRNLRGESS